MSDAMDGAARGMDAVLNQFSTMSHERWEAAKRIRVLKAEMARRASMTEMASACDIGCDEYGYPIHAQTTMVIAPHHGPYDYVGSFDAEIAEYDRLMAASVPTPKLSGAAEKSLNDKADRVIARISQPKSTR